jgi:Fur family peroxide stress response transcriptional regulator
MEANATFLTNQLSDKGIRATFQRVKVLEYLYQIGGHPTVEEIFRELSPGIPSLSKVTVYNTLHLFVNVGLARVVEIDDAQMRYDITLDDHGHFLCEACGTIYDFAVSLDPVSIGRLDQFKITQKNVYFRGLCQNCFGRDNH